MKKQAVKLAVTLIAAAGLLAGDYLPPMTSGAFAQASAPKKTANNKPITAEEAQQKFRAAFPDVEIRSFAKGPISSWYELIIDNERILYYNPEEGVAMAGDLFRSQQENLTQKRRTELTREMLSKVDTSIALKIGNGPKVIYEVTDPDCQYCRRGSEYLDQRQDVTRYIFFYPLPSHPDAPDKIRYIFSAPDPVQAYREVMKGVYDKEGGKPLPAFTDKGSARLQENIKVAEMLGVRGTPAYWINGQAVSGANIQLIEQLLQQ